MAIRQPVIRRERETESLRPRLDLLPEEFQGNPLRTMSRGYNLKHWLMPIQAGEQSRLAGAEYGLYLAPDELGVSLPEAKRRVNSEAVQKLAETHGVTISVPPYDTGPMGFYIKIARAVPPREAEEKEPKYHEPVHAAFKDFVELVRQAKSQR